MAAFRFTAGNGQARKAKLPGRGCLLLLLAVIGAEPLAAQLAQPDPAAQARSAAFQARVEQAARMLANEPPFTGASEQERKARIEFVVGNMLAVATHELGHAVISELNLPVLGREEDAADDYAILTGLRLVGNDFSYGVLIQAARGWLLAAERDKRDGDRPVYYDRHGLNEQRAYQIVCMMVGADPVKFKSIADMYRLPEERRRTCAWDYETAWQSWERLLAPHRRAAEQPKTPVEVIYGDAKGELELFARSFRSVGFLELLADSASDRYVWPAPITMEMRTCGEPNARWTIPTRRLHICYELAQEFAELYRDFGPQRKAAQRKLDIRVPASRGTFAAAIPATSRSASRGEQAIRSRAPVLLQAAQNQTRAIQEQRGGDYKKKKKKRLQKRRQAVGLAR